MTAAGRDPVAALSTRKAARSTAKPVIEDSENFNSGAQMRSESASGRKWEDLFPSR
jgi:hypothetical protein